MKRIVLIAAMAVMSVAASAQEFKFGYVDFTEIVQLMPEMDSARVQLDAASVEAQETYAEMVSEYQTKAQQFQQKQATWSASIRDSKQVELQQIEYRIQEFQQAIQQDLQQLQNSLQAPIYEKAQNAVNAIAMSKGIAVVFEKNSLLYVDPAQGIDLTMDVRTAVNIPADRTLASLQAELQAKAQAAQMQ